MAKVKKEFPLPFYLANKGPITFLEFINLKIGKPQGLEGFLSKKAKVPIGQVKKVNGLRRKGLVRIGLFGKGLRFGGKELAWERKGGLFGGFLKRRISDAVIKAGAKTINLPDTVGFRNAS